MNQSGSSSAGRAEVSMNELIPEPLPKCFLPEIRQPPSSPAFAAAVVRATSPPLPGSEVIVPNHDPSLAIWDTYARCSSHASRCSGGACGDACQNDSTAGCIEATSATEASPRARTFSTSPTVRVDAATLSNSPPSELGTPVSRNPAAASSSNSSGTSRSRRCRS
jgi:hypothetical protein